MTDSPASGATSLEGYLYQLDVSVWAALDLLLAKKLAHTLTLEPASQEDLEADLSDEEPGALAAHVELASIRLVLQAKLRNTGPWKVGAFTRLLKHGTRRMPAAERLKDPRVFYLLVTSADVDGAIWDLHLTNFGERPKATDVPASMADVVPANAAGRMGILTADSERVGWKLQKLLEEAFRVPHSRLDACIKALRDEALARMRRVGGGAWTREQLAETIRKHDGYLAGSLEAETFVRPTNWDDLKNALRANHGVIITGPSGTGKTTAAHVLLEELRGDVPGITTVPIIHGPEQVRADTHTGPVVFVIEDPWGRYRFEPQSEPWNDELGKLLATASGNRWFVITSRSDVLAESRAKALSRKWYVELEADNYGPRERLSLFEYRLPGLPRRFQKAAADHRNHALERLRTPLEIQKYFDSLAEGPVEKENDRAFIERCIKEAHRDSIESTIVQQVAKREGWAWAAVVWGLLKARAKESRGLLPDIQASLGEKDTALEDGLDPFVNFLVNGRNLRQVESAISYYHPRVEAGLETAMGQKPNRASRVLSYLIDAFIGLDRNNERDWGHESAANLVQALRRQKGVPVKISAEAQAALDTWIAKRLSTPSDEFRNDLQLAGDVGSPSSAPSELARWLLNIQGDDSFIFGKSWSPEPDTGAWYEQIAADPLTASICDAFVVKALPFEREHYPDNFSDYIERLAPDVTSAFLKAASSIVSYGYDPNADVIAHGALKDLTGFEAIVTKAIAFEDKQRLKEDPTDWLAIRNGEYSEDYEQHLAESYGEDGYTADAFLKAYVRELRRQKGWIAVRDHPRLEGLIYAWIDLLRSDKTHGDEAEFLALAEKSLGRRHEGIFWSMVASKWHDGLTARLIERVIAGHADEGARADAANCFARHGGAQRDAVLKRLLSDDARRLLELFLDLRQACKYRDDRAVIEPFVREAIKALPAPFAELAQAMFDRVEPSPVVSAAALDVIRQLDPLTNNALSVEKAKLLCASGETVTDVIMPLIKSEDGNGDKDIEVAVNALKLAIAQGLWPPVEEAISHRFADVRQAALEALAARSAGPLPGFLLALAKDKGSRVRRALLEMLKTRRAPEHLDALVVLAGDTWSPLSGYYGQEADYPIAQGAAELLAEPPALPETLLDALIEIATKTHDSDVRRGLLTAIAQNGGAPGLTKVCELALSRENLRRSIAANRSLFVARAKIDPTTTAQFTIEQVSTRSPLAAVPMVMVIGARGSKDQVLATANALSTHPKRKALLLPLAVTAVDQDEALAENILKMLPAAHIQPVRAAMTSSPQLARDSIDDLGDVRVVEEVIWWLDSLFVPKKKKA